MKKADGKSKLSLTGEKSKILLVGGGKMGQALLAGWLREGLKPKNVLVVEPNRRTQNLIAKYKVRCNDTWEEIQEFAPNIIIFAIKPADIAEVVKNYQEFRGSLFISIAAGITIDFIKKHLGFDASILRAMPNLPATVGEGATVISPERLSTKYKAVTTLFAAVGQTYWASEEHMNLVTAISGSGPGYIFYMAECLMEVGESLGMEKGIAESLVLQTLKGSAIMAFDSDKPVSTLREEVSSKGGTTEAAIDVLNRGNFKNLIKSAVMAACERAKALSK